MVANFQKKWNREFSNTNPVFKTVGIIFIIIIIILIIVDFKIYNKKKELIAQINIYQEQIEEIKKSSQTLKEEIINAENVDYLEKLGYEQFDQARLGETKYMFVKSQKIADEIQSKNNFWNIKSWFNNFWQWIKNIF
jgi:cell division protein FtsB